MRILERLLLGLTGRQLKEQRRGEATISPRQLEEQRGGEATISIEQLLRRAMAMEEKRSPISWAVRVYLAGRLPPELEPYRFLEMKTKWGKIRTIAMPSETRAGEWMVVVRFIEEESE